MTTLPRCLAVRVCAAGRLGEACIHAEWWRYHLRALRDGASPQGTSLKKVYMNGVDI